VGVSSFYKKNQKAAWEWVDLSPRPEHQVRSKIDASYLATTHVFSAEECYYEQQHTSTPV
jgi:hypothetical protein